MVYFLKIRRFIELIVKSIFKYYYFLSLCFFISGKATAGLPFPDPMPLDYFLASKKPLIYTGKFTRIVYADGKTGELVNFTDRDLSGELSFVEKPENKSVADQFMEIIDAKIYMMAPDYTNSLKYFNQCEFKKLYISSKIDLINRIDRDLYYKSLVGSDVVVFLSYRVTYQRGTEKFSTPIFIPSFGYNWNDGKPLPAEYLTIVQDSAQKAGFLMPQLKFCNKNYDSISTKSGLGISCDK